MRDLDSLRCFVAAAERLNFRAASKVVALSPAAFSDRSKRLDQDISAVCAGIQLQNDGKRIESARIAYGGMAATPRRAAHAEAALEGAPFTEASFGRAMAALAEDFQPISDMRASAAYRLKVAQNLLFKAYVESSDATTLRIAGQREPVDA